MYNLFIEYMYMTNFSLKLYIYIYVYMQKNSAHKNGKSIHACQ